MAYSTPVAWKVQYSADPLLDAAIQRVSFEQSFGPGFSTARHTFTTKAALDGRVFADELIRIVESMQGPGKFTFYFTDLGQTRKSTIHRHTVSRYMLVSNLESDGDPRLVVDTVEVRAEMHKRPVTELHTGRTMGEILEKLAGRNGLEWDSESAEEAPLPTEFRRLLQCNITDHEFAMVHLLPRAWNGEKGGFRFFTRDGVRMGFSTLTHKAEEVVIDPNEVLMVSEEADSLRSVFRGGSTFIVNAFDPLDRRSLVEQSTGFPDTISPGSPTHEGTRQFYYPLRTQEAAKAWAAAWQGTQCWGYGFSVKIRGADRLGLGDDKKEIKPNLMVSLAGTQYRRNDAQRGAVASISHTYYKQSYTLVLHCLRNASTDQ